MLHTGEELSHLPIEAVIVLVNADEVAEPLGYLTLAGLIGVAMVHQNDHSVVLNVSDHSPNRLIDSSGGLL